MQDAHRCFSTGSPDTLVAVICDGAGSASFGGEGASLAARFISSRALEFARAEGTLPDEDRIEEWIDDLRELIGQAARLRELTPRDFATTLVAAIVTPLEAIAFQIGDGAIVARGEGSDNWTIVSWPEHGEYASTTYFVTDDAGARLRTTRLDQPIRELALFSDGIERLALDFQEIAAHGPFLSPLVAALRPIKWGKQLELSRQLAAFLRSDRVNQRTDDDKSLIVAARA